jgi:hypothetical protein
MVKHCEFTIEVIAVNDRNIIILHRYNLNCMLVATFIDVQNRDTFVITVLSFHSNKRQGTPRALVD